MTISLEFPEEYAESVINGEKTISHQFFDELKVLVFAPQLYDRPGRQVYFIVDDGRGGSDTTRFTVFVE